MAALHHLLVLSHWNYFFFSSVVLFDHLSVYLSLWLKKILFKLLHLTFVCSLFHDLSIICLQKRPHRWAALLTDMFFLFACLNKQENIYSFIVFEIRKNRQMSELNELKCSKTPSQMSSCAHKHVFFLYLHAQVNINTLLYCSYKKWKKSWKKFHSNFL